MAATGGTNNLATTTLGSCLENGGMEQGPLTLDVPHVCWDGVEALLKKGVEDHSYRTPFHLNIVFVMVKNTTITEV